MQRAIARQAEAERERRAKIIAADGEFQAAEKLSQAANIISQNPATLQLRYLQTLLDIGVEPELDDRLPAAARHGEAVRGARSDAKRSAASLEHAGQLTGPEVRIDQLTGLRVILAPGRAERPDAFAPAQAQAHEGSAESCPFCEGREDRTPPEVWAARPGGGEPDTPGWTARAGTEPVSGAGGTGGAATREEAARAGFASSADPLARVRAGAPARPVRLAAGCRCARGDHPRAGARHIARRARRRASFGGAVAAWRERMRAHADDAAYLHLIVNEGRDAGASLPHSHAQLYALGFVPATVARERERTGAYHERTMGGHLLSTSRWRRCGGRAAGGHRRRGDAVCPWASRSPFELRVDPAHAAPGVRADGESARR